MRCLRLLTLLLLVLLTVDAQKRTAHVGTYTRKNGTVVHAHDRAAPGTAAHTTPAPARTTTAPKPAASTITARNKRGRIQRSATAKRQFEASHPCPSTMRTAGSCPGYVIDHIRPLACGGVDAPANMQWQTVAVAKQKDRWERAGCR